MLMHGNSASILFCSFDDDGDHLARLKGERAMVEDNQKRTQSARVRRDGDV